MKLDAMEQMDEFVELMSLLPKEVRKSIWDLTLKVSDSIKTDCNIELPEKAQIAIFASYFTFLMAMSGEDKKIKEMMKKTQQGKIQH